MNIEDFGFMASGADHRQFRSVTFCLGISPTAMSYQERIWTALANVTGADHRLRHRFSDANGRSVIIGHPKAPSPLRSAGALQKDFTRLVRV
jgi:hypothetical protein